MVIADVFSSNFRLESGIYSYIILSCKNAPSMTNTGRGLVASGAYRLSVKEKISNRTEKGETGNPKNFHVPPAVPIELLLSLGLLACDIS